MGKCVFTSFHYKQDCMRVQQVKQMGALAGQPLLSPQRWESIKQGGDDEVKRYIAREMRGKDCLVVLIGSQTAGRRWVQYESRKAWNDGLGVLGVHIHGLRDPNTGTSAKGANPFTRIPVATGRVTPLSAVVPVYDPPAGNVYGGIEANIERLIDQAITVRTRH
jgi:hypothetical protein